MIRFENVSKMLGGRKILDAVSFAIKPGETFVIVGPSGAGKSVTLKHMVRLLSPDDGQIFVDNTCISEAVGGQLEKLRGLFGYLFQGGALLAWLNVFENVALPLREKSRLSEGEIRERVQKALERVGLENEGEKMPSQISGGMCKRAGLARAIIHNPKIVLYDEPTSGLDPVTSRTIDALIAQLQKEENVTSVVVTHDLHSALSIGNRIAMLYNANIVELADPQAFVASENEEVQSFLESQFITKKGSWERKRS